MNQAYITTNERDTSLYDAHVHLHGSLYRLRLRDALSFVRHATGRAAGQVPFWNRERMTWESGFELDPVE